MRPRLYLWLSLPGSLKDSEGSVLSLFTKYAAYPGVSRRRVRQRKAGSSAVYPGPARRGSSESELHKGKGSMTPLAVGTTTSQLRMIGAHLAHPGGSPPCSPLWKCICSTPGLVEEAFEHGGYKRRETGWR